VYEVHTALGAVTLAASVGVLGLGNCYLVRITGRLTPGIMVHASFNAVVLAITVALSYR
jgi:membrane protease YdiL (CAAX protease family)